MIALKKDRQIRKKTPSDWSERLLISQQVSVSSWSFLYYYITACKSCNCKVCFLLIDPVAEKSAPDLIQWNHYCERGMKLQERELCLQQGEKPSRADLQFISERKLHWFTFPIAVQLSRWRSALEVKSRWNLLFPFADKRWTTRCEYCRSELEIRTRNEQHYLNIAITSSIQ